MLRSRVCLRHKRHETCQNKKSPDRWTGHSYDPMWSEWCCDSSCNQKSPLTVLSTFNLSGTRWQAERSGLWLIEAVHTDGQHFVPPSHERRPFLTVAPPPPPPRPALWRECPLPPPPVHAEKTKSECNVNHKVITHASTRISMSFGDAAPWMYLVSKSRGTHRGWEKATHKRKKQDFWKGKTLFFLISNLYRNETREGLKDCSTVVRLCNVQPNCSHLSLRR